jgi:hypothetical protein
MAEPEPPKDADPPPSLDVPARRLPPRRQRASPWIGLALGFGATAGIVALAWYLFFLPKGVAVSAEAAARSRAAPKLLWERTHGGPRIDAARGIVARRDGSLLVLARTRSKGAETDKAWLLDLDAAGAKRAEQVFGTDVDYTWPAALVAMADGGAVAVGARGDKQASRTAPWVMRFDAAGRRLWEKPVAAPPETTLAAAAATADGGIVVAGSTREARPASEPPAGAPPAGTPVRRLAFVAKLDRDGTVVWSRSWAHDANGHAEAHAVVALADGGGALAGTSGSGGQGGQGWILRFTDAGAVAWTRIYGGADLDAFYALAPAGDGLAAGGYTRSKGQAGGGAWLLKVKAGNGDPEWEQVLGAPNAAQVNAIAALADGGFVLVGLQRQGEGDEKGWVARLDANGAPLWNRIVDGERDDNLLALAVLADGGLALAGFTDSKGAGQGDVWIVRLGF